MAARRVSSLQLSIRPRVERLYAPRALPPGPCLFRATDSAVHTIGRRRYSCGCGPATGVPAVGLFLVKGSGRHCHSRRLRLLGRLRLATERPHRASPNIRCRCCACRCSFVRSRCSGFSRRNFVFVFLGASLKRPSAMRDLPACEQAWARVRDVACPPRRFVLSALRICRSPDVVRLFAAPSGMQRRELV